MAAPKGNQNAGLPQDRDCRMARQLRFMGCGDKQIAVVLEMEYADFIKRAWRDEEFLSALNPSEEEFAANDAWWAKRRERRATRRRSLRQRRPSLRVLDAIRARMWAALKGRTDGRLFGRLGYSIEQLTAHLEARFLPGMSWDNYGRWHVDHRRPCALFDQTDEAQFAECWSLDNLRPLWAGDNIKKAASYAEAS
jgi:hypothetical protein